MSDVNALIVQPLKEFYKDSKLLVQKCTKPDAKGTPSAQAQGSCCYVELGSARRTGDWMCVFAVF